MAILAAIVVILQLLAYAYPILHFTREVTLVLIPVVVGSAIYGAGSGAFSAYSGL